MKVKALLTLAVFTLISAVAQHYEMVVLDSSTNETAAYGINSYGYSSGSVNVSGKAAPCIWSPAGTTYNLSVPAGVSNAGFAFGISDNFEIVGTFAYWMLPDLTRGEGYGYVWVFDENVMDFLPYQATEWGGTSRTINSHGTIGGQESLKGVVVNIYDGTGYTITNSDSRIMAVNESGNATGSYNGGLDWMGRPNYFPVFVRSGTNGSSTQVTGPIFGGFNGTGMGMNNSNQVVGSWRRYGVFTSLIDSGFYWEPETGVQVSFEDNSRCVAINDSGTIVGELNDKATLWRKKGSNFVATDLNTLVRETNYTMIKAYGINAKGQIVGQCVEKSTGIKHAFMLTPTVSARPLLTKSGSDLKLSWNSNVDHIYRIKTSTDLKTWESVPGYYWADTTNAFVTSTIDGPQGYFMVLDLTP